MNPFLDRLHAYPFERLARLKAGVTARPDLPHIAMSIGEPQHAPPPVVLEALRANLHRLDSYPATAGTPQLRESAARWLERRFSLPPQSIDAHSMVLPVNGTREALFAFVQAAVDPRREPVVAMPNPFYQIYEGAALLAGAEPCFLDATPANDFLPDLDSVPAALWQRCQVLFLCSPGNPSGAVLPQAFLQRALALAQRHDFLVAADECYCEIYLDERNPPPGLLQAALAAGHERFQRCIVFHSLSKRSSVPGLRSGFVAGDPQVLSKFLLYRTYHGSAMPLPTQLASIAAWNDDRHAAANRQLYREKFERVLPMLSGVMEVTRPEAAFYLWPDVGGDDERFTRELFAQQNVSVLPGSYLARSHRPVSAVAMAEGDGTKSRQPINPGAGRARISLVAPLAQCVEAAERICNFVRGWR